MTRHPEALCHLALNTWGPQTIEEMAQHLSECEPRDRLSRVAVGRGIRRLVSTGQALAIVAGGVARYRLTGASK